MRAWRSIALAASLLAMPACEGTTHGDEQDVGRADASRADVPGLDAPGIDAPSSDGGSDAAAPDAPRGPGCEGRDYLFCEDFEDGAPGALPAGWTVGGGWQSEASNPEVSEVVAHSGTRSLRSAIAVHGHRRAEVSIEDLGASRGTHWGRVYYRVSAPFFIPGGGVVHNTMVALLGADESRVVDTVVSTSGMHQWLYNLPDDSCCPGTSYDWRYEDAWHCAEWRVDATTQSYQFFYDGDEVEALAFTGRAGARMDQFRRIALGWRNYQDATTPYESYFDDLAIDDARIGCD